MATAAHISAYETVARGDFDAMVDVTRYARRSPYFDEIIHRTDEHFWDPNDPDYINFETPLDEESGIVPRDFPFEMNTAVADKLTEEQQIQFCRDSARWSVSQILHGEQGAYQLSVSLCDLFVDPGAQEYMGNQVREEGRHVHAFSRYVQSRFPEGPFPVGDTLGRLLGEMIRSDEVYKKVIGMQLMVEGLAMGAFATFFQKATDPLLSRLCQLTMTDEAFHHKFGKIWADAAIPEMSEEQRHAAEDWSAQTFEVLRENLANAYQKRLLYAKYGLAWEWVREAIMEAVSDDDRREMMKEGTNIFRTLIKTIQKAGLITDRTRGQYEFWVDLDELEKEGNRMVGDDIAEAAMPELIEISKAKGKIIKQITVE